MTSDLKLSLRCPAAFTLARAALDALERLGLWPTPLNYELWLHYVGDPKGGLAQAIDRLLAQGEPITEQVSETLAAEHLPRLQLGEELRDAGVVLHRNLENVSRAIAVAQQSSEAYGRTLEGAGRELDTEQAPENVRKLVEHLSGATRRVQRENTALERRLNEANQEVRRLGEHLEQVRRDSMTDSLTGLPNRKAFDEGLAAACEQAAAYGRPLCLAVVDIDHFKRFNDTWGHQTGDQVIRYVASVLASIGARPRMAARYGGEEFAVYFPAEDARSVLRTLNAMREQIGSRVLRRRSTNEELGMVTVSAGLAQLRPGESAAGLIERADEALYASKRTGRNRVTAADERRPAAEAA